MPPGAVKLSTINLNWENSFDMFVPSAGFKVRPGVKYGKLLNPMAVFM